MAAGLLDRVEDAGRMLRHAVAAIDAGTVSGADAERLVRALSAVAKTADAGVAILARRLEETARWKAAQAPSPEAHLGALCGESVAEGRRLLETSRRLDELPATREAMESGRLSVEQAGLIAAAAGDLADAGRTGEAEAVEHELLGIAGRGNFGSLRTAAEQARQAARDEAAQRKHLHKTRFLRKRRFDDGGLGGTFKLEPGVAVELYAWLDAETDRQFRLARAEGRRDGHEAYAADALVQLIDRGVTTGPAAGGERADSRDGIKAPGAEASGDETSTNEPNTNEPSSGEPGSDEAASAETPDRPEGAKPPVVPRRRAEIIARVDLSALYRGHPTAGEVCEIAGVGAVPVGIIRDLLGEALLTLVLHDGVDVMNVTCAGRRGSKELRTAVLERAGHVCETCGTPYGLEIDHTDPFSVSGPTSYDNLAPGCRVCHGTKTAAEATVTIRAGRERAEIERRTRQRLNDLLTVVGRPPPDDAGRTAPDHRVTA